MYGAVYVACVIVLIIQTAECSCPCETEQQCKIIKDDNRKEVMLQSFFCGLYKVDSTADLSLQIRASLFNTNDLKMIVYIDIA